ncbi:hypothetical protein BV378_13900 [Nostoc sp. RF31YmG]|jgi:copper(I)-binding protein|nr:hypothetical protein BV378_13900 [Nostoc sp. RF31YmG]
MIVGMNTTRVLCLFLAVAGVAAATNVHAAPAKACAPQFRDGWVRLPPAPSMPMAAGFGTFVNACAQPAAVASATSSGFDDVSLHESVQVEGVNRMREVARLALPANGQVALAPGGLHLMLMQPKQALVEGASVPVTFKLEDGRSVEATLQVRKTAP